MNVNKLVIVIVTWNNEKDIRGCLKSIANQNFKEYKILVIDNNSTDNTKIIIKNEFPEVVLVEREKNYFLTASNNLGIRKAINDYSSEFVMVLNPDTLILENTIDELLKVIQSDPSIGAVGPKVLFHNKDQGRINSAGIFFDGFLQAYDIGIFEEDRGQFDNVVQVFGVTGACILFRTQMLKEIGFYWEKIKLYYDEVELFIRAKKKGWKVFYVGKSTILHKYMVSSEKMSDKSFKSVRSKALLYIGLRHYPFFRKLALLRLFLLKKFIL